MPRSGPNGTFDWNPGDGSVVANTTISPGRENSVQADVRQTFNTVQPITYGGTGVADGRPLDNTFGVKNNTDTTKVGVFNAAGIPTATTRTYDLPYYSGTLGLVSDIRGYIFGLTLTNDAGDLTNDIAFAAGSAVDSTGTASMLLAVGLIKRVDVTWAVGTNQGGRFYTTLTDGTIYEYVIRNPTTGVVDCGFSDNATNPTGGASYPAGYTQYARVGSYARVGGVNKAPRSLSQNVTDWVPYTITTQGFGAPTDVAFYSRRNGDSLEVVGTFASGISTANEARVSLGFNGTNDNVVIAGAAKFPARATVGSAVIGLTSASVPTLLGERAVSYLTFGIQSAGGNGYTKVNGNGLITSGLAVSVSAILPIEGW